MSILKNLSKAHKIIAISIVSLLTISGSVTHVYASTNQSSQIALNYVKGTKPTQVSNPTKTNTKIILNGQPVTLNEPVLSYQDRIFLPVRSLSNLLGASVNYDAANKIASVTSDATHIELPLNRPKAIIDGSNLELIDVNNSKVVSFTYDSRTYLPTRFISEQLGIKIAYANNTISITTDGSTPITPPAEKPPVISKGDYLVSTNYGNSGKGRIVTKWKSPTELQGKKFSVQDWKNFGLDNKSSTNFNKVFDNVIEVSTTIAELPCDIGDEETSATFYKLFGETQINSGGPSDRPMYIIFKDGTMSSPITNIVQEKGLENISKIIITDSTSAYAITITGIGSIHSIK